MAVIVMQSKLYLIRRELRRSQQDVIIWIEVRLESMRGADFNDFRSNFKQLFGQGSISDN